MNDPGDPMPSTPHLSVPHRGGTEPNPDSFPSVRIMVSNAPSPRDSATMANFATVQKSRARDAVPKLSNIHLRLQLLQILQQLPPTPPDRRQLFQNSQQLGGPPADIRKSRTAAARAEAAQKYEKFRRTLDAQPSSVEVHFDEAVKKAKQLEQPKKKTA